MIIREGHVNTQLTKLIDLGEQDVKLIQEDKKNISIMQYKSENRFKKYQDNLNKVREEAKIDSENLGEQWWVT
ncbi:hypothetical protein [Bacillus sp. B1-b2]|uniref:hypothetical protein n=1 Tax=Bacillus sp. B1-b2 TaxID=2653201 RepID=UPI00126174BB|nr:hypothetical protein [Bacillus sp. B1-b2]KAB7671674.1 hypothetical protein F9279_04960 [Bacillus sp. B1-b2]